MCPFGKLALSIHRALALGPALGVEVKNKIGLCLYHHHRQVVHCRLKDQEIRDGKCTVVSAVMEGHIRTTDSWSGGPPKVSEPGDWGGGWGEDGHSRPAEQQAPRLRLGDVGTFDTSENRPQFIGFQFNQRWDVWSICPGCGEW